MKRVALMVSVVLAFSLASWANSSSLVFSNTGGKVTVGGTKSAPTLNVANSDLTSFTGFNGAAVTGNLGYVGFSTAGLLTGSLAGGGTFAGGGSFDIIGNGSNGLPNGVLFQGTFTGPVQWFAVFNSHGRGGKGNWTYVLYGNVTGTLSNGSTATGGTVQVTFDVPSGQKFSKGVLLAGGKTTVTVPEPGTLGLLGTGLLGIAGLVRRKMRTRG